MSAAMVGKYFGWPLTQVKNGTVRVAITGRNAIGKAYCNYYHRKLHGALFLWVLWMLYEMGPVNEKYLIDLAMMVVGISLIVYVLWSYAISYEAEIVFTADYLFVTPAHSFFQKRFSRKVAFGWDIRPHYKATLIDPSGRPNATVLYLNHKNQFLAIAVLPSEARALAAMLRCQSISEAMETVQAKGLNAEATENDPFAGRPGF